jgi:hypothetical protein
MPIITCTNPWHGKEQGYDPNQYSSDEALNKLHLEAHETTYLGAVIGIYERNMHDDSDFYAVVWDAEEERVKTIQYATTRGWTYHHNASADATIDVLRAADEWTIRMLVKSATDNWSTPGIGKRVKSLTTRGRYVGMEGVILRFEDSEFNRYDRLAVVQMDKQHGLKYPAKISQQRVKVLGEPDQDELLKAARQRVASHGTMSVVRSWSYV